MRFLEKIFDRNSAQRRQETDTFFDQYCNDKPSHQNAVDILPGWNSAFPAATQLKAGSHALFADPRIDWAVQSRSIQTGRSRDWVAEGCIPIC
jgi:hypothetical protein